MRCRLGKKIGDAEEILQEMEAIVNEEICNSTKMIALCEADSRLGYHSEAEGYKFFPEKLRDRIEKLESLKNLEFTQVRQNISEGKAPLSWYEGTEGPAYMLTEALETASFEAISEEASFRAAYDSDNLYVELKGKPGANFVLYFEFELMWPAPGIIIKNGEITLSGTAYSHQSVFGEKVPCELDKYKLIASEPSEGHYILTVSRKKAGWAEDRPIRALISADGVSWIKDDEPVHTLGKHETSPGEFGWLLPMDAEIC